MASNNPNGRPKGTTNHKALWAKRQAILDELDPLKVIWDAMKFAHENKMVDDSVRYAKEILPYVHGKKQAVDDSGDNTIPVSVTIEGEALDRAVDALISRL
jgi:hypothetical protein